MLPPSAHRPWPPPARARLARRAPLGRSSGPATLTRRSPSHGRPPPLPRRPAAAPQSWPWRPSARSPTLVVFVVAAVAAAAAAAPEAPEYREAPPTRPAPARGARWRPRPRQPAPNTPPPHPQHAAQAPPTARAGGPTPRAAPPRPARWLPSLQQLAPGAPPTRPTLTPEVPPPEAPPTHSVTPAACAGGPPPACVSPGRGFSACLGPRDRSRALTNGSASRRPPLPFPHWVPRKWAVRPLGLQDSFFLQPAVPEPRIRVRPGPKSP